MNRLLKIAVSNGVLNAIRIHIAKGDDLNARDEDGNTPLMIAARKNKIDACKLLLDNGADPLPIDSLGKDAAAIAFDVGAIDTGNLIKSFLPAQVHGQLNGGFIKSNNLINLDQPIDSSPPTSSSGPEDLKDSINEWNIGNWEPEYEATAPKENSEITLTIKKQQREISNHVAIDKSADWEDIDVLLPVFAEPIIQTAFSETRAEIREMLLRVIREGSVPDFLVQDTALSEFGIEDLNFSNKLRQVINDLGGQTDERHEYISIFDDFSVHIDDDETLEEELTLNAAIDYLDNISSTEQLLQVRRLHPDRAPGRLQVGSEPPKNPGIRGNE